MGLIIPWNIEDTIKYTKEKIVIMFKKYYSLNTDDKFILVSVLLSYILALYVKDQMSKGNKDILRKVGSKDPIFININNVMYMYSGLTNVIRTIKRLHQCRNNAAHDYPTLTVVRELEVVYNAFDDMRELCSILGIEMQQKPVTMFNAANLMAGE